ncbi:hypothetical protein ABG79_00360 [Caloramator mitchellensis]|uniref:Uncharacterized protein n=1 Tax=Caloramator mitchellensis TaxID=908809 RepID=A0A0R3JVF6_CALMK|nr:hypothetical protein [Caloramator mitchellensis]KRQ87559.1 hypothetical protein ABG79_00360 [Caloramator mitchellensis]
MKNKVLVSVISVILILLVVILYKINFNKNAIKPLIYDAQLPENVEFIDSIKSKNFYYKVDILINKIKTKDSSNYTSLQYIVTIEPKNNQPYRDILVTVFIDKLIFDMMAVKSYPYFGNDITDKQEINTNSKNNKGLIIGRTTWLYKDTYVEKIRNGFKKGVKIKVKWDNGFEYVLIPYKNIKIEVF